MLAEGEKKIASITEEMDFLKKKYKEKKFQFEKSKETLNPQKIGEEVLSEHIQNRPEKILDQKHQISKIEEENMVSSILNLPAEQHDKQIEELLAIAEERGVINAVSIVRKLGNPHLEDDFHRALVQIYLRPDLPKFKFKKPLSVALGSVLYEISFPKEEIKDPNKTFKNFVSAMEQFYNGMASVGEDKNSSYFTLELGLPTIGEEIVFYAAIPKKSSGIFEKQIEALFPNVKLEQKKEDYNIFKPEGIGAGATAEFEASPVLPIKTYDKFDVDPMLVIANSFSKLRKMGEGAALQIIIAPAEDAFNKKIKSVADDIRKGESFSKSVKKHNSGFVSGVFSALGELFSSSKPKENSDAAAQADENLIKLLDEKAARRTMLVNMRILVSADSGEKAEEILNELKGSFSQFSEAGGNKLKFKEMKKRKLKDLFYNFSFRIFDNKNAIRMNTAELASIFHFPPETASVSQIKNLESKDAPPPLTLPESGLLLGKNYYRGKETDIFIGEDDRRRHLYIIGQTGTGKSALIKNMIAQDIENGKGVCFIDPHGSDLQDILARIPKNRMDDLIYFNPGDTERPMGLNMLEYDAAYPEQKTFIVNELLGIFNKLFDMKTAGGPMFEQYFRNAAMLVMDNPGSGNTLLEISRVMGDKSFRDYKLSLCGNPVVKSFWKDVAEKAGGEAALANMVPYITSKFDAFLTNDIMRPIISMEKSAFNFRQVMDEGKILLVNLSKGRLGDINSNLIGLIIVGKLLMASLSRADAPEDSRKDFYLYIDEFQNVTTDSISAILSEARKYRLNLTIAHQFIGQLEDGIKKAVFGNVGSIAAFRTGAEDAEFLEKQFEPVFNASDLMNVANYSAYVKLLTNGHSARPFSMATIPFEKGDLSVAEEASEISSMKYGVPKEQAEAEINKKYNRDKI